MACSASLALGSEDHEDEVDGEIVARICLSDMPSSYQNSVQEIGQHQSFFCLQTNAAKVSCPLQGKLS